MEIVVRPAELKDVSCILEIINYEILNTTVVYDYQTRTYEQQLNWFRQKQRDNQPIIVAEMNGDVIGFGTYGSFRPREAYKFSIEHSIYINAKYRGTGVGKILMRKLIGLAKQQGYHTMIAGVDGSNKGSVEFHKKFGFTEVGHIKEVGYKFDKWLDLVFLQLILTE
ncbi:N-acetyltransferase family protein [Limibacter armeniacum]|uniref:GNAT family N-acetyltransferase n=1 Tax=Limibacter armeniacum TaxID=466084 RepID=UPI002FE64058